MLVRTQIVNTGPVRADRLLESQVVIIDGAAGEVTGACFTGDGQQVAVTVAFLSEGDSKSITLTTSRYATYETVRVIPA